MVCDFGDGDVVVYRHGYYETPIWCFIIDAENGKAVLLKGMFSVGSTVGATVSIGGSDCDLPGRECPPPEEWPDEIVATIARYRLTGELDVWR